MFLPIFKSLKVPTWLCEVPSWLYVFPSQNFEKELNDPDI